MKYATILADPPWKYRDKLDMEYVSGAEHHYPCMSTDEIKSTPLPPIADNAHLYLWTTNAFMLQAHFVCMAWGFEPKTIITWIKDRMGMGMYYRNTTEHLIFAVRGRLPCKRHDMLTHYHGPRKAHSEKPRLFYQVIEDMSPGPYVELFARVRRDGWDAFGNQVPDEMLVDLPFYDGIDELDRVLDDTNKRGK